MLKKLPLIGGAAAALQECPGYVGCKNVADSVCLTTTLLKKHALDSLLEQAAVLEQSPADKALTEEAVRKSQELSSQITNGIFRDMPKLMEKFMRPRPVL